MMLKTGNSNIELLHLVRTCCCLKAWWTVTQGKNKKEKGVGEKENRKRKREEKGARLLPFYNLLLDILMAPVH